MEHDMDMIIFWIVFLLSMVASLVYILRAYRKYLKTWKENCVHPNKPETAWQFIGEFMLSMCVPSVVLGIIVSNILYRSGPNWYQVSVNFSGVRGFLGIAAYITAIALLILGFALWNHDVGNIRGGKRKSLVMLLFSAVLFILVFLLGN